MYSHLNKRKLRVKVGDYMGIVIENIVKCFSKYEKKKIAEKASLLKSILFGTVQNNYGKVKILQAGQNI